MPVTAFEIMVGKIWSMRAVVLAAMAFCLFVVVGNLLGVPNEGSRFLLMTGRGSTYWPSPVFLRASLGKCTVAKAADSGAVIPCLFRRFRRDTSTKRLVHRLHHGQHLRTRDAVMDRRSFPPRFHQAVGPEPHELLRHRHLFDVQFLPELGDGLLLGTERAQDQQALRMRQAAQQFGSLAGSGYHFFYIHVLEFIIFEC